MHRTFMGLFWIALLAGASYSLAAWGVVDAGGMQAAWKTSGVALLALWAALRAHDVDGWLIAAALAFGALGDLLLETHGLTLGGAAFAVGHVAACLLYLRNRRQRLSSSQRILGWVLAPATVAISAWLAGPRDALPIGAYAAFLGVMAACAWTSRFPRYRVGIGAVLFVVSDFLIFSRGPVLELELLPRLLVWPTYFMAQALIAWGVVKTLSSSRRMTGWR